MRKWASIFLLCISLSISGDIFAIEGYIGENPGLSFYSQIDEGNYTIEQKFIKKRLKETPTLGEFGKKCLSKQVIDMIGSSPTDQSILEDVTYQRYGKLSELIAKSGRSISTDTFQELTLCLASSYTKLRGEVTEQQGNMENWSYIGLYMDGDTTNSDYDIVADIDKIDTIIFSQDIRYNGVKNTGAKSFRDLLDGKKAPPLFPTGSTGSRLYTGQNNDGTDPLGSTPPNPGSTNPVGASTGPNSSSLSSLIGGTCSTRGEQSIADLSSDPYLADELYQIITNGNNTTYGGGYTPSTSLTPGDNSNPGSNTGNTNNPNAPKTSGSDFFHDIPCSTIFCIKVTMVGGSENLLGGGKNISIEGILDKHSKILEPISNKALRSEGMTNNFASLPFASLNLKNILAGLNVTIATSPQRTRNDKKDETPARKEEQLEAARRCAFFSAGLDTDKLRANAILGAGYSGRGGTTTETQINTTKPLGAQEVAEAARFTGCMERAISLGRENYYDSISTDLTEIEKFTYAILSKIEEFVTEGTKLNNKPVKG